ncbi:CRISPR-associated endonuclease/helicase Cas3 [Azospirillaceae bacterium]
MMQNIGCAVAKARYTENARFFLSLLDHSADVAAMAEALLELPTTARRLAKLGNRKELDRSARQRLCVLAALHDVGKVNIGFQNRIRNETGAFVGHVAPVASLLWGTPSIGKKERNSILNPFKKAIGADVLLKWTGNDNDALDDLLAVVWGHHGSSLTPDLSPPFDRDAPGLWSKSDCYDPVNEAGILGRALKDWFPAAFEPGGETLPTESRFLHAFAGLVVWADWLGSDETRFGYPRSEPKSETNRIAAARAAAQRVVSDRRFDAADRRDAARALQFDFPALFPGFAARPAQTATLDLPAADDHGSVMALEAETGSGKTEAALLHFLRLLREDKVDGLYFALPTRASAKQIQTRITQDLRRILADAAPPVGLAVPGYIRVNDRDGQALPNFKVLWPDQDASRSALHDEGWAVEQTRRYLAGAVMVGTIDQLLLGGLTVRHAQFRSSAMLRQLLVIDEVHASDPYMERLLFNILDQHRAAGGHALLMSATLGSRMRHALLGGNSRNAPSFDQACVAPYPALHLDAETCRAVPLPADAPQKSVALSLAEDVSDLDALAQRAIDAASAGARVLIIRNTVSNAVALQRALEQRLGEDSPLFLRCRDRAAPHHARFAAEDRVLLDAALEARLGKNSLNGGALPIGALVVATQTAEQSLDIDADFLISDLCPIDVLLQRIGRLHRHARSRPLGFEGPAVLVVAPSLSPNGPARLGCGTVYPNLLILAATRNLIREQPLWSIPQMNRALVEAATHSERLETLARALGPEWEKHLAEIMGKSSAERRVADSNCIDWTEPPAPPLFKDEKIQTRLGLDSRSVALTEAIDGPFGLPVASFSIPGWMVKKDTPSDAQIEDLQTNSETLSFRFGDQTYRYDRYGLA